LAQSVDQSLTPLPGNRETEDDMIARTITWSLALQALVLHTATAQAPATDIVLHCEGTMNAVLEASPNPITRSNPFSLDLRLKDGSIVDTGTGVVEGAGCALDQELIRCEATRQYPIARLNAVVKRSSSVVLNRKTGELTLLLESWDTPVNSDTPTAHMRVLRTGTCRNNALF
jgi:hypothetical protein